MEQPTLTFSNLMTTFMKDGITSSGMNSQTNQNTDTTGSVPPNKELARSMKSLLLELRQSTTQIQRTLAVLSS
jgi:hypothetical protein